LDILALGAQKLDGREMECVERAHGHRKRFERAREDGRCQLEERDALQKLARMFAVRCT